MRGKPQSTRMELMPQQVSLIIRSSRLPNIVQSKDCARQVTQENRQAQHISSSMVDIAARVAKASGIS